MDNETLEIARRLKELREFSELSAEELARSVDIPVSEYKSYELGEKEVPAGALYNIAAKLGVDPSVILSGNESTCDDCFVVYEGKGKQVNRHKGYSYTSLSYNFANRKLEPMLVDLSPDVEPELVTHTGQEFNYVLEGSIRLIVGEKEYYLHAGDSAIFKSNIPHSQTAMGKKAKFLSVILDK